MLALVAHHHAIDLARLRRLNPGRSSSINWSWCGCPTGSISIEAGRQFMRLANRYQQRSGAWQEVQQSLHFIETETCFGGRRRCVSMRHQAGEPHLALDVVHAADVSPAHMKKVERPEGKAVFLALADDALERSKIGMPCASAAISSASMMHEGRAANSAARRGKRSVQLWP